MSAAERSAVMDRARWNARENATDTQIPVNARILAIASGKGGVGKSSVTVNLAAALAAGGATVGVLDADIWGFSIPRMLGMPDRLQAERVDGHDKPMIIPNERRVGNGLLKVVSTGMLVEDEGTALMWRGLMLTKAVEQFLNDVHWGELDYLLIDMPPGTGDVTRIALGPNRHEPGLGPPRPIAVVAFESLEQRQGILRPAEFQQRRGIEQQSQFRKPQLQPSLLSERLCHRPCGFRSERAELHLHRNRCVVFLHAFHLGLVVAFKAVTASLKNNRHAGGWLA